MMSKPKIASKTPYVEEAKPGQYAWCSCGESSKQPYCDGSHKGTEFRPKLVKLEEDKKIAWCGCKNTSTPPFCDGTHNKL